MSASLPNSRSSTRTNLRRPVRQSGVRRASSTPPGLARLLASPSLSPSSVRGPRQARGGRARGAGSRRSAMPDLVAGLLGSSMLATLGTHHTAEHTPAWAPHVPPAPGPSKQCRTGSAAGSAARAIGRNLASTVLASRRPGADECVAGRHGPTERPVPLWHTPCCEARAFHGLKEPGRQPTDGSG